MDTSRKIAIAVGALFIITMVVSIIDSSLTTPLLNGSLADLSAAANIVHAGVMLQFVNDIGVVAIALLLYPILRRESATVAAAYLSFRVMESILLIAGALCSLYLVILSQTAAAAGVSDSGYYLAMSETALQMKNLFYQFAMAVLGVGSLLLCYQLYRTRLVPRLLSAIGFIGYVLLLASALLDITGAVDSESGAGMLLYLPGGLFEILLFPAWLIMKGFNRTGIQDGAAIARVGQG